jgi:hypothetical protein
MRLPPNVALILGALAVLAAGIATGISIRDLVPRGGGPYGDPALSLVVSTPLLLLMLSGIVASSPTQGASWTLAATFTVAMIVSCGPIEGAGNVALPVPASNVSVALPIPAPTVMVSPRVSELSTSDVKGAVSAPASGLVAIDISDRAPGVSRKVTGLELGLHDTWTVAGWALDQDADTPCEAVGVVIDGRRSDSVSYGFARVDVARYFHDSARTNVGYSVQVPAAWLGAGHHVAVIICKNKAGKLRRSSDKIEVDVDGGKRSPTRSELLSTSHHQ